MIMTIEKGRKIIINNKNNIFIGGVARAGKSTISEKICASSIYNHFPVDYIATSFKRNFPQCGINDQVIIDNGSVNLSLFLSTIIEKMMVNYVGQGTLMMRTC